MSGELMAGGIAVTVAVITAGPAYLGLRVKRMQQSHAADGALTRDTVHAAVASASAATDARIDAVRDELRHDVWTIRGDIQELHARQAAVESGRMALRRGDGY